MVRLIPLSAPFPQPSSLLLDEKRTQQTVSSSLRSNCNSLAVKEFGGGASAATSAAVPLPAVVETATEAGAAPAGEGAAVGGVVAAEVEEGGGCFFTDVE